MHCSVCLATSTFPAVASLAAARRRNGWLPRPALRSCACNYLLNKRGIWPKAHFKDGLHGAQAQTEDYKRQIEELTARLSNLSAEKANLESRNTLLVCSCEGSAFTEGACTSLLAAGEADKESRGRIQDPDARSDACSVLLQEKVVRLKGDGTIPQQSLQVWSALSGEEFTPRSAVTIIMCFSISCRTSAQAHCRSAHNLSF